ncbi:ISL3 family transposase [Veillonella sp. CHU732]|uniref:ISL3 family transposase n=1 Tax=Veillonella sp. CHU732 TaxID=2490949 RepID=UPI000F8E79FD|nr:ISL3 family transposase [Veillonella sp. CHU732]
MSIVNYTEIIFKIKEEYIKHTRVNEDGSVHFTLEIPVAEQVCPHCGASTRKSKGKRSRDVKFGAMQHHTVTATYLQRRYKCQECNHTFIEKNPFVSRYLRLSKSNLEYLFRQLGEKGSFTEMAKRSDVSVSTVIRYCSKLAIPKPAQLPTVLGIDEYKGNAEGQMYQVIITDLRNHSVVDILPKRETRALIQYFKTFSKEAREQVKYIVMDMCPLFKLVMQTMFSHAHIVADRYHVCRLVDWALERVRKREQKQIVTHSRMLKYNRRVLMKNPDTLTENERVKLLEILRISDDLRRAYGLRLGFRKIFKTYSIPNIERHIQLWLKIVESSHLPEFSNFKTSFISWFPQIVNAFVLPYSNGFTEGCNNNIKVLKRISYGLRHFERFRVRILLLSQKNSTSYLNS